jgi:hypothetical protein
MKVMDKKQAAPAQKDKGTVTDWYGEFQNALREQGLGYSEAWRNFDL